MKFDLKIIFIFSILLSSCSSIKNWTQNLGFARTEKDFVVHGDWVRRTTAQVNEAFRKINRMSPIISGNMIIQGNAIDGVAAFDSNSGRTLWRKSLKEGVEASGSAYKDRIYLATSDSSVYSLNATTGETIWVTTTKSENLAQPLFDQASKMLFVLAGNNTVHAFDSETGKSVWLYTRQDTSSFSIRGGAQPLLKDGLLYVGFSEGSFVALNVKSGTVAWEINLNKNKRFRDIDATAVIDKDRIYVSGFDDKLYAISLKGEILWRLEEGGYSALKVEGEHLYYPTTSGLVLCLDKNNGKTLWNYKLKDGLATQVQIYKGLVLFGESQGKLIFLNSQDGRPVGSFEPGRGIMASPTIDEAKSKIYFISGEANLYSVSAQWKPKQQIEYLQ